MLIYVTRYDIDRGRVEILIFFAWMIRCRRDFAPTPQGFDPPCDLAALQGTPSPLPSLNFRDFFLLRFWSSYLILGSKRKDRSFRHSLQRRWNMPNSGNVEGQHDSWMRLVEKKLNLHTRYLLRVKQSKYIRKASQKLICWNYRDRVPFSQNKISVSYILFSVTVPCQNFAYLKSQNDVTSGAVTHPLL